MSEVDQAICPLYTPKFPPFILQEVNVKQSASNEFRDLQQDKYKMENISVGQKLMQDLPFIELKEIVGMQPSQVMEYANTKFKQWEPSLPKMPCIYVYETQNGGTIFQQEYDPCGAPIAKIDHYIVTDIPKPEEKPLPKVKKSEIVEFLERIKDIGVEV